MKQKRTAEDYLKTIHILSRHGEVRGTHIADVLGVSRATVSLTLKALEQEGYLLRMADHTVRLTDAGPGDRGGNLCAQPVFPRDARLARRG